MFLRMILMFPHLFHHSLILLQNVQVAVVAANVGVEVPAENEEVQTDAKDSKLTMEKFDIPLPGHSVAVLVNGEIIPISLLLRSLAVCPTKA
jgi:hypothetical protein